MRGKPRALRDGDGDRLYSPKLLHELTGAGSEAWRPFLYYPNGRGSKRVTRVEAHEAQVVGQLGVVRRVEHDLTAVGRTACDKVKCEGHSV